MKNDESKSIYKNEVFLFFIYILFAAYIYLKIYRNDVVEFVTPEGQEEVLPPPESGPY
jgi:hypothetical protein